ncbi:MAG: integrase family protein [Candidatus Obscuribacterales bacterium]|nr:integrase family protein [Candidatus Obscuribacterales bacterium]
MPRLNKTFVDKVEHPATGAKLYFDEELKGFGLRVTAGSKTYFAQGRVKGKVCRVKIGKHGNWTPKQAEDEAKDLLRLMEKGINPNTRKAEQKAKSITLAEVLESYKQSKNLRPTTIRLYDGAVNRCLTEWQNKPIVEITKDMVERRHKQLSNANGPRGKGEAQAHQVMRVLRCLFNYALATYEDSDGHSILQDNPVRRLSQIKAWNRIPRRQSVIHDHQLPDWYQAVMSLENDVMRDFFLLCLFTGLRRGEASKLKWCNVDFKNKTLTIPSEEAKNHDEHRLPLSDYLIALLGERAKVIRIDNPYVFPGEESNTHMVECKRAVERIIKNSGVKFMVHDLRRTFLTTAEKLDIPHYAVKKLANHRNSSDVTLGYIVTDVERLRMPMQKISAYFLDKFIKKEELKDSEPIVVVAN